MGLLDELLGQLAGGGGGRGQDPRVAQAGGGTNMTAVMAALLPVVMAMLNSSRRGPAAQEPAGGGLGGLLASALGQGGGGGGLADLLEGFQRAGFGDQVRSWVGTGQNQGISPDVIGQVFGQGGLGEIARRAGLSEQDASSGLARLLPEVVDHLTPEGRVPDGDAFRRQRRGVRATSRLAVSRG